MQQYSDLYNVDWVAIGLKLLNERSHNITLAHIARETDLSPSWISQFAAGKIPNPSIQNLATLIKWFDQ